MPADTQPAAAKSPPVCTLRDFRLGVRDGMIDLDLEAHEGVVITWRMTAKVARKIGRELHRLGYFESTSKRIRLPEEGGKQ